MGSRSGSDSGQLAQAVSRLRSLQEEIADRPAAERRELLIEELQSAAARVLPPQREAFFEALLSRFPAWDASAASSPAPAAQTEESGSGFGAAPAEAEVDRIVAAMKRMDESRRATICDRLQAEGLIDAPDP